MRHSCNIIIVLEGLLVGALAAVMVIGIALLGGTSLPIHTYVQEHAVAQTGAINLVSAIYLDYRLFDTLAEAVVLIVVVLGIFVVMRNKE